MKKSWTPKKEKIIAAALAGFFISRVVLGSTVLTIPLMLFAVALPYLIAKRRAEKR